MASGEFDRIATYFKPLAAGFAGAFQLGDDAAAFNIPEGQELITTADAMVEGTHFLVGASAESVAWRALRSNISDLAAMGATPLAYMLCIGLPERAGEEWLAEFSQALAQDQKEFNCQLIGGDTVGTKGPIFLSITAFGLAPAGAAIRRRIKTPLGPNEKLDVYVSGSIGDSWAGLTALQQKTEWADDAARKFFMQRHLKPSPRVALGLALREFALAAVDISDGLVADVGHIAEQSSAAVTLEASAIPFSPAMERAIAHKPELLTNAITGGEDYELAFVARPEDAARIKELSKKLTLRLTRIGALHAGKAGNVAVIDAKGQQLQLIQGGWNHF